MSKELIKVSNIKKYFPVKNEGLFEQKKYVKAVDGISFVIYEGETLGLVGESGCGKSTTGKMIVKLHKPTEGSIHYDNKNIFELNKVDEKEFKRNVQMIFQDPYSSLNPRQVVGKTIEEPLKIHKINEDRRKKVIEIMKEVGLREEVFSRYPHEFSGGQRQRVGVARALALNPSLIVCDEPVSALDVSIQAQILNLMNDLQEKFNLTYLFISHDLSVVKHICDRIAVMYLGRIVELSNKKELFENPMHPYTKALLKAIPIPDPENKQEQGLLVGDVPSPIDPPSGCRFHTRCSKCMEICKKQKPEFKEISNGHFVECHLYK